MNSIYLLALAQIFLKIVLAFKTDHAVKRQSKSIFSGKRYTETITPARYSAVNHIKYDNSPSHNFIPEHYFPDVEYPINLLEASNPFHAVTGANDAFFSPFTKDVITNFNSALKTKSATSKINTGALRGHARSIKDASVNKASDKQTVKSNLGVTDNLTKVPRSNLNKNVSIAHASDSTHQENLKEITFIQRDNIESEKIILPVSNSKEQEVMYYDLTDYSAENITDFEDQVEVFYINDNGTILGDVLAEDGSVIISGYSTNKSLQDTEREFNDEFAINYISVESDKFPLKISPPQSQHNETQSDTISQNLGFEPFVKK